MIYTVNTKLCLVQLVFVRYSSVDCSVLSCTDIRPKTCSVDEDVRSEIYWGAFAPCSVLDVAKDLQNGSSLNFQTRPRHSVMCIL